MFEIGTVVKALKGHEAGQYFAVLGENEGGLLLADGRRRTVDKPKRKSKKHILTTNTVLSVLALRSNKQLRRALHDYNFADPIHAEEQPREE